jgi:hypothetical protein
MRFRWGLTVLMILMVLFAGCSTTQKMQNPIIPTTQVSKSTPTPVLPPVYHIGDIVKEHSDESAGMVILDYTPSSGVYRARPVYIDDYGKVYFLEYKGETSFSRPAFESKYRVTAGHIENPYRISVDSSKPKPKFDRGEIVSANDKEKIEGIIILDYNPSSDTYRIRFARYIDGIWKYDGSADASLTRSYIEQKYPYKITTVNPDSLSQI